MYQTLMRYLPAPIPGAPSCHECSLNYAAALSLPHLSSLVFFTVQSTQAKSFLEAAVMESMHKAAFIFLSNSILKRIKYFLKINER